MLRLPSAAQRVWFGRMFVKGATGSNLKIRKYSVTNLGMTPEGIEDLQEIPWKLSSLVRSLWIFEAGFETRPVIYNASFLSVVMVTKTTEVDLPTIQPFSVGKTSMRLAASRVVATKVLVISLLGRVASKVFWRRQTGWGRKVSKSHELIDICAFPTQRSHIEGRKILRSTHT